MTALHCPLPHNPPHTSVSNIFAYDGAKCSKCLFECLWLASVAPALLSSCPGFLCQLPVYCQPHRIPIFVFLSSARVFTSRHSPQAFCQQCNSAGMPCVAMDCLWLLGHQVQEQALIHVWVAVLHMRCLFTVLLGQPTAAARYTSAFAAAAMFVCVCRQQGRAIVLSREFLISSEASVFAQTGPDVT